MVLAEGPDSLEAPLAGTKERKTTSYLLSPEPIHPSLPPFPFIDIFSAEHAPGTVLAPYLHLTVSPALKEVQV